MGLCQSKKHTSQRNDIKRRQKNSRTNQSFVRDEEDINDRKRSSRMSNTRNSVIIAARRQQDSMDQVAQGAVVGRPSFLSRVAQNIYQATPYPLQIQIFNANQEESSYDSYKVKEEEIDVHPIYTINRNINHLKKLSEQTCVLINLNKDIPLQYEPNLQKVSIPFDLLSNSHDDSFLKLEEFRNSSPKSFVQKRSIQHHQFEQFLKPDFMLMKRFNTENEEPVYSNFDFSREITKPYQNRQQGKDFNRVITTMNQLIETVQLQSLNQSGLLWILRKYFNQYNIEFVIEDRRELHRSLSGSQKKQNEQQQVSFEFSKMPLLSTNVSKHGFQIKFLQTAKHNFRQICCDRRNRNIFVEELEGLIKECVFESRSSKLTILWLKAIIEGQNEMFFITFYIPMLPLTIILQKFLSQLQSSLQQKFDRAFQEINTIQLVEEISFNVDSFDVWSNREFKSPNLDNDEMWAYQDSLKFVPPMGWKRFGLKHREITYHPQWANGYFSLSIGLEDVKPSIFYELIQNAIDMVTNEGICGIGVVMCSNINHLILCYQESLIPMNHRIKPMKVTLMNEEKYYYLAFQGYAEKSQIKIPSDFDNQFFIVSHLDAIRVCGILVKEITAFEYEDAIKLV